MSTSCLISKKVGKDTYKTIYCHFDGYVFGGVGEYLTRYYNNEDMVDSLLALGDISSLGKTLDPTPGASHTFDFPEKDVTVSYSKDRGESGTDACDFTLKQLLRSDNDYLYYYDTEKRDWFVNSPARNGFNSVSYLIEVRKALK